jgi:hypothetical protein
MNDNKKKNQIGYLIIVLLLNPLIFIFIASTKFSLPDSYAYIAQAENLYSDLLFHTGSWGHVDSSLVLAPLYPLLIALLMKTGVDGLNAAIYISLFSGFLFSILAFYFISTVAKPFIAVSTAVALNASYIYFNFFTTALTESVFMTALLGAIMSLSWMIFNISEKRYLGVFVTGFVCSIAFLAREIGITIFLATIILFLLNYFLLGKEKRIIIIRKTGIFILGFFILVMPYQSIRFFQTSASPFTQSFRMGQYTVTTDNTEIIESIEINKNKVTSSDTYEDIYKARRELMKLLPDSSEMLNYVMYDKSDSVKSKLTYRMINYPSNIIRNIEFIVENAGHTISLLFFLSCIAVIIPMHGRSRRVRIIIPVFLIVYIALISYFTGDISRYIEVIVPFIWLHLCMELNLVSRLINSKYIKTATLNILLIFLCPAIVIAGSPRLFYEKKIFAPNLQLEEKLGDLGKIVNGDTVFTQFPFFAYSVGGQFRQLPNDSLEKVVRYGNLTGVNWLLVVDVPEEREVMQYWSDAYVWIAEGIIEHKNPKLVSYCCGWYDEKSSSDWKLYKIHPIDH